MVIVYTPTFCVRGEFGYSISHSELSLQWRHNGHDSVSNHQPHNCLLNRLFKAQKTSEKTSEVCVTGLCAGNSPVTDDFPAQMASNAEKIFIWWRHHGKGRTTPYLAGKLWGVLCKCLGKWHVNTLKPRQNGRNFAGEFFQTHFLRRKYLNFN